MSNLHLFQGYGVELEYAIVDEATLSVRPLAARVLEAAAGSVTDEVEMGALCWSNELMLHVLELKTNGPATALEGLAMAFQSDIGRIEDLLRPLGARLMPTGMHPWMDPDVEAKLWPHGHGEIYAAFHRIFDCRGHGWSNLQSAHLNLPFHGDSEFGRLHAAIRLVLPLLPALAASSPVQTRRPTGLLDTRLEVYRHNCRRVPSVTAQVVPEGAFTRREYERLILQPMYREIAPLDPDGVLQHEWLNARGAIARFDRDAIEIRVLDTQECPAADLAVLTLVSAAVRALCEERWAPLEELRSWPVEPLARIFLETARDGEKAALSDPGYLACFGLRGRMTAGEAWRRLADLLLPAPPKEMAALLRQGTLARRILRALDAGGKLEEVYRALCDCLRQGRMFEA